MDLIKAYHSSPDDSYKRILEVGAIKPLVIDDEIRAAKPDEHFVYANHLFTYFSPIRPYLGYRWGNSGLVFDIEVLIKDFGACWGYDVAYTLDMIDNRCKPYLDDIYLDRAKMFKRYGIPWSKSEPGPLYGDDALETLTGVYNLLNRATGLTTPAIKRLEVALLIDFELRCLCEVPISAAYSKFEDVPDEEFASTAANFADDTIHTSQWETLGYETRLNQ